VAICEATISDFLLGKPSALRHRVEHALSAPGLRLCSHGSNDLFVKTELRGGPCKFKPRVINNVRPDWLIKVGPWLKPIDHHIRTFNAFGHAKHWTPNDQAKWIFNLSDASGYQPVYLDVKSCDLSISRLHFLVESMLFRAFGLPAHLILAINDSENTWVGQKRFCNYDCRFTVTGRVRQSGDPQTSICNNHIVIMAHAFVVCESYRLLHDLPRDWYKTDRRVQDCSFADIMNNGDDSVILSHLSPIDLTLYEGLGMQVESTGNEFCQSVMLELSDGPRMVRHPREVLSRVGYTVCTMPPGDCIARRRHAAEVAVGMSFFSSHVPIYWTLFSRMYYLADVTPDHFLSESYTIRCWLAAIGAMPEMQPLLEPTTADRFKFSDAFGISPSQQIELEELISKSDLYDMVDLPWLDVWFRNQWEGQDSGLHGNFPPCQDVHDDRV
jgi:hypothetical protein